MPSLIDHACPDDGEIECRPTGDRRLSPEMIAARLQADSFAGCGVKPLALLAAFEEAVPYLNLPAQAVLLVSWLVRMTRPVDWEPGNRPIAWPSARRQAEHLGLSPSRVKTINRALAQAGVVVMRDSETGRRYGGRDAQGRIVAGASGFDLSPLALRYDEFVHMAAEARVERGRMDALRKRSRRAQRAIRQTAATLAGVGPMPEGWPALAADVDRLARAAEVAGRSEELSFVVHGLERLRGELEHWIPVENLEESVPSRPENRPLILDTNSASNPSDYVSPPPPPRAAVVAREASSPDAGPAAPPAVPCLPPASGRILGLTALQLLDLVPALACYLLTSLPTWADIVAAAGGSLRVALGVSPSLWAEACRVLGREQAALALALVAARPPDHFSRGPGAYFAGMVTRAERGELHLDRTVWKLRQARRGKPDQRMLH